MNYDSISAFYLKLLDFTFSGFWSFIGGFFMFCIAFGLPFKLVERFLFYITVLFRSWPPAKVKKEKASQDGL
jgi:hypothetical protein